MKISLNSVKQVVKAVLSLENQATDEVAVYFVSEEEISRLHLEYFDDPSPTDCISFPLDAQSDPIYHVLGEIFVCPKTAIEYTLKSGEAAPKQPYLEATLYLVHGLLHLLGYDDIKKTDQKKMRAAEARLMEYLIQKQITIQARNRC